MLWSTQLFYDFDSECRNMQHPERNDTQLRHHVPVLPQTLADDRYRNLQYPHFLRRQNAMPSPTGTMLSVMRSSDNSLPLNSRSATTFLSVSCWHTPNAIGMSVFVP
jgi:hypothetical protein